MRRFGVNCLLISIFLTVSCMESMLPSAHTLSVKIEDSEGYAERLLFGPVSIEITDNETSLYSSRVNMRELNGKEYVIESIIDGSHQCIVSGDYYESKVVPFNLERNDTITVSLEPKRTVSIEQDRMDFDSRVNSNALTIKNLTQDQMTVMIDIEMEGNTKPYFDIVPELHTYFSSWMAPFNPGETRNFEIKVSRNGAYGKQNGFLTVADTEHHSKQRIPVMIETTARDYSSNFRGKVTDTSGKPLKDVYISIGGKYSFFTNEITKTDAKGEYSFDEIERGRQYFVTAFSERWAIADTSLYTSGGPREYEINFSLSGLSRYLLCDKKEIDFGNVSEAKELKVPITLTGSDGAKGSFGTSKIFGDTDYYAWDRGISTGWYPVTFDVSLNPSSVSAGKHKHYLYIYTEDAGCLLIPVTFEK